jgi:hypothetical protein
MMFGYTLQWVSDVNWHGNDFSVLSWYELWDALQAFEKTTYSAMHVYLGASIVVRTWGCRLRFEFLPP